MSTWMMARIGFTVLTLLTPTSRWMDSCKRIVKVMAIGPRAEEGGCSSTSRSFSGRALHAHPLLRHRVRQPQRPRVQEEAAQPRLLAPPVQRVSPTSGAPTAARCARTWCSTPVEMRTSTRLYSPARSSTRNSECASRAPSPSSAGSTRSGCLAGAAAARSPSSARAPSPAPRGVCPPRARRTPPAPPSTPSCACAPPPSPRRSRCPAGGTARPRARPPRPCSTRGRATSAFATVPVSPAAAGVTACPRACPRTPAPRPRAAPPAAPPAPAPPRAAPPVPPR